MPFEITPDKATPNWRQLWRFFWRYFWSALAGLTIILPIVFAVPFYDNVLTLDSFPVEIEVSAVVEGEPVTFTERVTCYEEYEVHTICMYCKGWVVDYSVVGHVLESGHVFLVTNGFSCRNLAALEQANTEQANTGWQDGCSSHAYWADNPSRPGIIEIYDKYDSGIIGQLATDPHIQISTIHTKYRMGPREPRYFRAEIEEKGEPSYWYDKSNTESWYTETWYNSPKWWGGAANVITEAAWSPAYDLPQSIATSTEPVSIIGGRSREALNPLRPRGPRYHDCWISTDPPFTKFRVPYRVGPDNEWRLDHDNAGIETYYRQGTVDPRSGGTIMPPPNARIGTVNPAPLSPIILTGYADVYLTGEGSSLDSRNEFVFDPVTRNIYNVETIH